MNDLIELSNINKSFDNFKKVKVLKKFHTNLKKEKFIL